MSKLVDDIDDADYYSEEEGLDEDQLDDQEYEKLYSNLPKIKKAIESYNDEISSEDLKEALYFNLYNIEDSVQEIKSKFPRKIFMNESATNRSSSQSSKLAKLVTSRGGSQIPPKEKTGSNPSKLSALVAKARTKEGDKSLKSSTAIIDRLRGNVANVENAFSSEKASSLSKAIRRKASETETLNENEVSTIVDSGETMHTTENLNQETTDALLPEVVNLGLDQSILLSDPLSSLSCLLFEPKTQEFTIRKNMDQNRKKRKTHSGIFDVLTNLGPSLEVLKKAKQNFSRPSPDEQNLKAQSRAFESSMKNMSLDEDKSVKQKSASSEPKTTKPFKKIDVNSEIERREAASKQRKSFVVIGHVDAGKSTLVGRILLDLKVVDAKTIARLTRESEKIGKGSFALAWIFDQTNEERSRGVTVDICSTRFDTGECNFTAIDAPGHKDFVPQMIGGVSQADIAILVVDAINGEFEAGFALDGQTKEHTILARNIGLRKICVVINKMDRENWSQERYGVIKDQIFEFLTNSEVGFKPDQIDFIPISGLTGANVVMRGKDSSHFDWYKGPTLIQYLENTDTGRTPLNDISSETDPKKFILTIFDISEVSSSEIEISGKVMSGHIQAGETVMISPMKKALQIQTLKIDDTVVPIVYEGDPAKLRFKKNQQEYDVEDIASGDILSSINSHVMAVNKFRASIFLFNLSKPLFVGSPFILFRGSNYQPARVSKVINVVGSKRKKAMHLTSKQTAEVEIELQGERNIPLTKFEDNKFLGRIVLRREGVTIGAGTVTDS